MDEKKDVIVISSDGMIKLAMQIFKKNKKHFDVFSDNQFLITESCVFNQSGKIESKNFISFYEKLMYGLSLTKTKYILLMLDDYLVKSVNAKHLLEKVIKNFSPDYVNLRAVPVNGRQFIGFSPFTITTIQSFYRVNMQPSLWKKAKLQSISDINITPWKMEIEYGVSKNKDLELTLGTRKDIISCSEIVKSRRARPILSWLCGLDLDDVEKISYYEEIKITIINFLVSIAFFFKGFRG